MIFSNLYARQNFGRKFSNLTNYFLLVNDSHSLMCEFQFSQAHYRKSNFIKVEQFCPFSSIDIWCWFLYWIKSIRQPKKQGVSKQTDLTKIGWLIFLKFSKYPIIFRHISTLLFCSVFELVYVALLFCINAWKKKEKRRRMNLDAKTHFADLSY